MSYYVKQTNLSGVIEGSPSKSVSHRILLLATLKDYFEIDNLLLSDDIYETINFIKTIGFDVTTINKKTIIKKIKDVKSAKINLNASASTMRFIIPFSLIHLEELEIELSDNLANRLGDEYIKLFCNTNIFYHQDKNKITIKGNISDHTFVLYKTISSQFITGLLLTLPFLEGTFKIEYQEIPSIPYINLTLNILRDLGVDIETKKDKFIIKGNQTINNNFYKIENDFSSAAFYLVANKLGANINIKGLNENSLQGDRIILEILNSEMSTINLINYPDLAPILFTYAVLSKKETTFTGLDNLKYKESNRLIGMLSNLEKVGAKYLLTKTTVKFKPTNLKGGVVVKSYNDHRVVMSMIILGTFLKEGLIIDEINSVAKSYPRFFDDYKILGGLINVK